MSAHAWLTVVVFFATLTAFSIALGRYMARVYTGESKIANRAFGWLEALLYRASGVDPEEEMTWRSYAAAVLLFNLIGTLVVYVLLRVQSVLPMNPEHLAAATPEVAFNTATSFASNTNWQAYGGESTLSYFSQMIALTVQNFLSAATGMAVLVALLRGFTRRTTANLGNFWVDLVRSTTHVLLPMSFVFALVLVAGGVVQTFAPYVHATFIDAANEAHEQVIALGPAASQIAIKQLGTNGGGFFNANSAHPFENPNPFTNFLELLAILLIPGAFCFTFGELVADRRQGIAVFAAMAIVLIPLTVLCVHEEEQHNPALAAFHVDAQPSEFQSGGNMEGKEVRFGPAESALWAAATTAASNGSVNAMHDSFMPIGGLVPMVLMQFGEIIFGGVGSGLYGMLVCAIIAVFIAGLMVGRTPEYLGKKIESFEMKMASLVILFPAAAVLVGAAVACLTSEGTASVANPGAHGFSEILYAFSSGANNNGSAFGGLTVNGPFYATSIGIAMLVGRFWLIVPVLAMAGSLAKKKSVPVSLGTLPTHTPLFVGLLVGTVILVGALTYIPALALGPIVEQLTLFAK